jgi:plasmid stability protein
MANLTVTIDDELLRRARIRALEQGTSVNALLRQYLEAFASSGEIAQARSRFVELARAATSGSGTRGRTWTRDDLHER